MPAEPAAPQEAKQPPQELSPPQDPPEAVEAPAVVEAKEPKPSKDAETPMVAKRGPVSNRRMVSKLEMLQCWPEALAMLENGAKVPDVAAYIQDERKEYTHVNRVACEQILYYWVRKHPDHPGLITRAPIAHVPMFQSMAERVDPLDAINLLLAIQIDRINIHYRTERRHEKMSMFNNDALRVATDMVRVMADLEKQRRPSASSEPKDPNDTMKQFDRLTRIYADKWGNVAASVVLNSSSRSRVAGALQKIRRQSSPVMQQILDDNVAQAAKLRADEEQKLAEDSVVEAEVQKKGETD